jgi:hypothetical protein
LPRTRELPKSRSTPCERRALVACHSRASAAFRRSRAWLHFTTTRFPLRAVGILKNISQPFLGNSHIRENALRARCATRATRGDIRRDSAMTMCETMTAVRLNRPQSPFRNPQSAMTTAGPLPTRNGPERDPVWTRVSPWAQNYETKPFFLLGAVVVAVHPPPASKCITLHHFRPQPRASRSAANRV